MALTVNGEIFNYKEIKEQFKDYPYTTESDCEVILPLYLWCRDNKLPFDNMLNALSGDFAFVLCDYRDNVVIAGRDCIGVNPLYYRFENEIYEKNHSRVRCSFASELKALVSMDKTNNHNYENDLIKVFPPRSYMVFQQDIGGLYTVYNSVYYSPKWMRMTYMDNPNSMEFASLKEALTKSVEKRLMSEVPFGCLLSGGLDSSLIASITVKLMKENPEKYGDQKLQTFSIGLKDAPDLKFARMVAEYLGTDHHEFNFEPSEGINAINDVIYHLETYDITTIRASTPMFLMSKRISDLGIKMVLSGEGADEIFGGYLYFHQAPSDKDFDVECRTRVYGLHLSDCLRANKSTMAHGIEVRVPFLDKDFLDVAMLLHPQVKCTENYTLSSEDDFKLPPKIEKFCLRQAFNDGTYLPDSILWRQKEQFSDGVGYDWIDGLRKFTETHELSHDLDTAYMEFNHNTPATREALYYRRVFAKLFPHCETTVVKWVPKTEWKGVSADPSGRAQLVHLEHKVA